MDAFALFQVIAYILLIRSYDSVIVVSIFVCIHHIHSHSKINICRTCVARNIDHLQYRLPYLLFIDHLA